MPKVLMVTPYWPPVNKVGVWRALRTARYLPDHNWTPVICTPNPEQVYKLSPLLDSSCHTPPVKVIQPDTFIPSMSTARSFGQLKTLLQDVVPSESALHQPLHQLTDLIDRGSFRLIAELLLPDQFVEWGLHLALQYKLGKLDELNEIDVLWVTGGPFGFFVAGVLLAKALNKPLVLDYRDPWTTHRPARTWWIAPPQSLFRQIEAWALSHASAVSYIHHEALMANRAAFGQKKDALWSVIINSFDPIDLGDLNPRKLSLENNAPALVYAGNFYNERSAAPIIKALLHLDKEDPLGQKYPLTLHLFGQLDKTAQDLLKHTALAEHRLKLYPRHSAEEIGAIMKGAEALLLVIGEGSGHQVALSGKIWDYLAAGSPILGIGPRIASAKKMIAEHKLGIWVNSDEQDQIVNSLKEISHGQLQRPKAQDLKQFHASEMSRKVAQLLDHAYQNS